MACRLVLLIAIGCPSPMRGSLAQWHHQVARIVVVELRRRLLGQFNGATYPFTQRLLFWRQFFISDRWRWEATFFEDSMTFIYAKLIGGWKNPGVCCLKCSSVEGKNYVANALQSELASPGWTFTFLFCLPSSGRLVPVVGPTERCGVCMMSRLWSLLLMACGTAWLRTRTERWVGE